MLFNLSSESRRPRRTRNLCGGSGHPSSIAGRLLGALGLLSLPLYASAQAAGQGDTLRVSLAAARRLAFADNPELLARRVDTTIAKASLRQAGSFRFNPTADVLAANGSNGTEIGVSQEVEVFGQRGARVAARRAGVSRAAWRVADATRITIGDVDRTFYRVISARERSLLADSILALNRRLVTITERQLAAGEISRMDYNLAAIELGRSQSRALSEKNAHRAVSREFGRLLGISARLVVFPVLDSTQHHPLTQGGVDARADARLLVEAAARLDTDSLVSSALRNRPDLLEQTAAVRESTHEVAIARKEILPNLVLRAVSEPASVGDGRVLRGGVGVSLPLLNRNRGEIQARRSAAEQAELDRLALEGVIATEVVDAVEAYQTATSAIEVFESSVLPSARQNRVLLESAYREGKVGLPVLLLIRNQLGEAEMDYWSVWLREREAYSDLKQTTAENLSTLPRREGTP